MPAVAESFAATLSKVASNSGASPSGVPPATQQPDPSDMQLASLPSPAMPVPSQPVCDPSLQQMVMFQQLQQQQLLNAQAQSNMAAAMPGVVAYGCPPEPEPLPPPEITAYRMDGFRNAAMNGVYWKEEDRPVLKNATYWTIDQKYFFYYNVVDELWRVCPATEPDGTGNLYADACEGGTLGLAVLQKQKDVDATTFIGYFLEFSEETGQWPMVAVDIYGLSAIKPHVGPSAAEKALDSKRPTAAEDKPWAGEGVYTEAQYQPSASSSAKPSSSDDGRQADKRQWGYGQNNRQNNSWQNNNNWQRNNWQRNNQSWQQSDQSWNESRDWSEDQGMTEVEAPSELAKHFREGTENLATFLKKTAAQDVKIVGDTDGSSIQLQVTGGSANREAAAKLIQEMIDRAAAEKAASVAKPSQASSLTQEGDVDMAEKGDDGQPTASPQHPGPTSSGPTTGESEADMQTAAEDLAAQAPATDVPPDDIPPAEETETAKPSSSPAAADESTESPQKQKGDGMTTGQLRELLKDRGVKNLWKMTKAQLLQALQETET